MVDAIAQGDALDTLEIIRVGAAAEAWNAVEAFRTFEGSREKRMAEARAAQKKLWIKCLQVFLKLPQD